MTRLRQKMVDDFLKLSGSAQVGMSGMRRRSASLESPHETRGYMLSGLPVGGATHK